MIPPMKKIAVLMGGQSGEHDVSLESGKAVLGALDRSRYEPVAVRILRDGRWTFDGDPPVLAGAGLAELQRRQIDVVFPALHGPMGEDGTLQGALEMLGLPFVGSGVTASALAMDKPLTKRVYRDAGFLVAPEVVIEPASWARQADVLSSRVLSELGLPVFVKPARLGSSVGIHRVTDPALLSSAITACVESAGATLVEALIEGREVTAAVLDDPDTGEPEALPLVEIRPIGHDFFDYVAKYTSGHNEEICPAPVDADTTARVKELGLRAHRVLGCRGMSRTDFILTNDGPLVLETNTIPGLTTESLIPKAARAAGMSFPAFIDRVVRCAMLRAAERRP